MLSRGDLEKFAFSNGQNPIFFSGGCRPQPRATIVKNGGKCPRVIFGVYFHFAKNHDTMLVCRYTFSPNFLVTCKYAGISCAPIGVGIGGVSESGPESENLCVLMHRASYKHHVPDLLSLCTVYLFFVK